MDQKRIQTLALLLFCQKIASEAIILRTVAEEKPVEIYCSQSQNEFVWLRVEKNFGMKVIGSKKEKDSTFNLNFSDEKISSNILVLKSFLKTRDSGIYSCASFSGNSLDFGEVTRLVAASSEITTKEPPSTITYTTMNVSTSNQACVYNSREVRGNANVFCEPVMLGSLAGGCGLLLLLLIITIGYCNRTRTRGCPHHTKIKSAPRKQQEMAGRRV